MAIPVLGVGLLLLILLGSPIGFALAMATIAGQLIKGQTSLLLVPTRLFNGAVNFPLVAIPLFVLAGQIMNDSGISRRLVAHASALVGFMRGGLAHVSIVTSMFFAEMSGSAVADAAALGTVLIPAMARKGYPRPFAATVVSSAATIAVIIPPSIPMILYAVTAEVSVSQMFLGGIIPGILFGVALMVVSYIIARVQKYPIEQPFHLREVWTTFRGAVWSFMVPVIILGGIFSGIFTATEAAGVAIIAALVVGTLIHREYHLRRPELVSRPQYVDDTHRVQNRRPLTAEMEAVTVLQPRAHWLKVLEEAGVPCGPILDYAEVFADPHVQERGMVQEVDHPVGGRIRALGPAVKLSETPAAISRPSPLYGQHTAEVLGEIGYAGAEIQVLAEAGVVVLGPSR